GHPVGAPELPQQDPSRQVDLSVPVPAPGRYTIRVSANGAFAVDVSGALAPADTVAPALTLDPPSATTADPTPALGGSAGDALGDFPGVVLLVLRANDVVRRIGAARILGRWSADVEPALPDGAYTVVAEQGDASGNASRTPPRTLVV